MNTLIAIFKLLPAIVTAVIGTVQALEEGFAAVAAATGNSVAKTGAQKLSVVENAIQAIYSAVGDAAKDVPIAMLTGIVTKLSSALVGIFKTLGWFKGSTAAAA